MPRSLADRARIAHRAPILAAVAAVLLLAALLLRPAPGRAQGGGVLEATSPAPNARLTESPSAIGLRCRSSAPASTSMAAGASRQSCVAS